MSALEQKEITIGGKVYTMVAFPATVGLEIQVDMANLQAAGLAVSANLVEKAITNGAYLASAKLDKKLIDKHFSRKYKEMMDLFEAIIKFNFSGDEEDPNASSDTSDK